MQQDILKEKFFHKGRQLADDLKVISKEFGNHKVDEVSVNQVLNGMRSIKSMLWETSALDANEGIRFRGYNIADLRAKLPRAHQGSEPLPEGLFWLMLVGEVPSPEEVHWLTEQWVRRSNVPEHVFRTLDSLPLDTHPMTQFTIAINAMQTSSVFQRRYVDGLNKNEYWDPTYEDTMNLLARLPKVAAYIFRRSFFKGKHIPPDISLDWGANFSHMLGNDLPEFYEFMRLYLTIHADHEGGNASAHATHLVGSTLSDAYLSLSAGMNALAGPLHGLANQEVIRWIFRMIDTLGTSKLTEKQITDYVNATIAAGRVVPGYGHAVLRVPDPRFMAQKEFAEKHIGQASDVVNIVWKIFNVVPDILGKMGKVSNPYPNVDAHSGAILVHYGMDQYNFYTVMFGVSRAMGVLAALCWSRILGLPIERPKSVTTAWLKNYMKNAASIPVLEAKGEE